MKVFLCAMAGLLLSGQVGAAAERDILATARELAEKGQQADALRQIDRALAEDPGSAQAQFLKGFLLARVGREAEAQEIFLDLTRRYPQYPEPFNNLAVLYAQRGEYERAVEILKQALQTHSSYGAAYENLTKVYGKLASRAYDRALGQESSTPSAGPGLQLLAELDGSAAGTDSAPAIIAARPPGEAAPTKPMEPLPGAPEPRETVPVAPVAPAEPIVEFDASAVVSLVEGWARAWSEQRVEDYLGFYSRDFLPEDGSSRDSWSQVRAERIRRPRRIEVEVDSIGVRKIAEGSAQAKFNQTYRSDRFEDRVVKTLDLVLEDGNWKIRAEMSSLD
jgi:thioredoxin-like negative regulator of GroEL